MALQAVPLVAPLLVGGGIGVYLLGYLHARGGATRDPAVGWLVALTAGVVVWSFASAASLVVTALEAKLLCYRVLWLGTATVGAAWPAFVFAVTGRDRWARPPRVLLVAAVPAVAALAAVTSPLHSLFLRRPRVVTESGVALLEFDPGPLLVGAVLALWAVDLAVAVLLLRDVVALPERRRERLVLLVAGVVPWAGGLYSVFTDAPVDFTPMLFAVTVPLVTWAVARWHLFDFATVARERAIDGMEDGLIVLDAADRVVYANATAREAIDLEGVDGLAALRERCPAAAEAVDEEGTVAEFETDVEGGRAVFEIRASAVTDDAGDRRGRLLYLDDLTDRRAVERRYGTIIERSSALVVILDADGVIQYASPGHEAVLGYRPDELVGEPVFSFIHPDDRELARDHFASTLADDSSRPAEHRLRTADGGWITVETVADDLLDDPVIGGVVARAHDVTARRRYEQRLSVLHRVLRHNLRNDLNVVQGYAADLADSDDPEVAAAGRKIRDRAERLVALGQKATVADRLDVRPEPVEQDLAAVVEACADYARAAYPHADVTVDCPGAAPADADALAGVAVQNAIDNAVEHNDAPRPRVDVTVSRVTRDGMDYVEVAVADDGPPIPDVDREAIAAGEESPLAHATGLGLWLIYWIVAQSNGELTFDEYDGGNVVRMTFPVAGGEASR